MYKHPYGGGIGAIPEFCRTMGAHEIGSGPGPIVSDGVPQQLVTVGQLELLLEVLAVGLDGLDADEKLLGDLAGAQPATHPPQHLELAVTEPGDGGGRS